MNLLFVVRNPSFFYQYRTIVDELCREGHSVHFLLFDRDWRSAGIGCELLEEYRRTRPELFNYDIEGGAAGFFTRLLRAKREIVNFLAYYRKPPISTSRFMRDRARSWLPKSFRVLIAIPGLGRVFRCALFDGLLEFLERWLPAEHRYVSRLEEIRPDLVVGSPYVFTNSREIDYLRAAKRMGIPTAAIVYSWDNLTTKGLLQVWPDRIVVWNRDQVKELERIHSYPPGNVIVAGSPGHDFWFEHRTPTTRADYLRDLGVEGEYSIVTYLCSSRTIAPRETEFIGNFARRFVEVLGGHGFLLVVRPHPQNEKIFEGVDNPDYIVFPRRTSDLFRIGAARDRFYAQLKYSECVVGMNTTAILEALILGRPSISILSGDHRETQENTPHFQYLANSGVVTVCRDFDEACRTIADVSIDGGAAARRRSRAMEKFVEHFIRPRGRAKVASVEIARALLDQCGAGPAPSRYEVAGAPVVRINQ